MDTSGIWSTQWMGVTAVLLQSILGGSWNYVVLLLVWGKAYMHKFLCTMPVNYILRFFCALNWKNSNLKHSHISGGVNFLGVRSRNHSQIFYEDVPHAKSQPTPIPDQMWTFLTSHQPEWTTPAWKEWLKISLQTPWHQALSGLTKLDSWITQSLLLCCWTPASRQQMELGRIVITCFCSCFSSKIT